MKRWVCVVVSAMAVAVVSGTGCKPAGVGDPCTPEKEYDRTFSGFDEREVLFESKSFQCETRLCLVNHFRGRVSCPYGQTKDGSAPNGAKGACVVPGSADPVVGKDGDANGKAVPAGCVDRTADKAVYCSCRCANIDGRTDDGANYCTCPDGFHCGQLGSSIGTINEGLTGGFCVKDGTDYNKAQACGDCDARLRNCGEGQL